MQNIHDYFEEKDVQFRVQIDKYDKKKRRKWPDLFYNDVIHRPKELSNLCVDKISMWFERITNDKNMYNWHESKRTRWWLENLQFNRRNKK